jgi:hypothetical protein
VTKQSESCNDIPKVNQTNEHHQGTTKKVEVNMTFFTRVSMDIEHERDDCGQYLFSTNEGTNKSTWG